jgi:hypothetical protein
MNEMVPQAGMRIVTAWMEQSLTVTPAPVAAEPS